MSIDTKQIECHAPGDKCMGCAHYHGKAAICDYAADTIDTKRLREVANHAIGYVEIAPDDVHELLDEIDRLRERLRQCGRAFEARDKRIERLEAKLARVEERADAWVASGSRSAAIAAHHVRTAINGEPIDHRVPELEES